MKHLKVLEDNGMVESFEEKSDAGGPPRKCYRPTKNFSIRIDFGPNTFRARMIAYKGMAPVVVEEGDDDELEEVAARTGEDGGDEGDARGKDGVVKEVEVKDDEDRSGEFGDILDDFHQTMELEGEQERLSELMGIVKRIDERFEDLDSRRGHLLMYREAAMREVNRIIMDLVPSYDSRRVVYYYLDKRRPTPTSMSEDLDLREKVLMDIFNKLRKQQLFFEQFE